MAVSAVVIGVDQIEQAPDGPFVDDGTGGGGWWATFRRRPPGSLQRVKIGALPWRNTREEAEADLTVHRAAEARK